MEALKADAKDPLVIIMIDSHLKQIENKEAAKQKIRSEARRIQTMAAFVNLVLTSVFETKNFLLVLVIVGIWTGLQVVRNKGAGEVNVV